MRKIVAYFDTRYPVVSRFIPNLSWRNSPLLNGVNKVYSNFIERLSDKLLPYADVEIENFSSSPYLPTYKLYWFDNGQPVCEMKFSLDIPLAPETRIDTLTISTFEIRPDYQKRQTQKQSLLPLLITNLKTELEERCDSPPNIHLHASSLHSGYIWGSVAWANVAQFRSRGDMFHLIGKHSDFLTKKACLTQPRLLQDRHWMNRALSVTEDWDTPLDIKKTRLFDPNGKELLFEVKSFPQPLQVNYGVYFLLHHSWSATIPV